jgi:hypothetical protein
MFDRFKAEAAHYHARRKLMRCDNLQMLNGGR